MKIGIIGFGQLGQLAARHLKDHLDVFVSDIVDRSLEAKGLGVKFVSVREAVQKDVVLFAVPIGKFEEVLKSVSLDIAEGALVMDLCSVKVKPVEIMERVLSNGVEIIAAHPLFGPQSAAKGAEGLKIVLCPIRTNRLEEVREFLESLGLKVIVTTPEDHDRQMAETGVLSHFIGKSLINTGFEQNEITEPSFSKLTELKGLIEKDSSELFKDIQIHNPFASEVREKFLGECSRLARFLDGLKVGNGVKK